MRFPTPLLALIGLLTCSVAAAPTSSGAVLAIPDPNSATYEADLAAAIAYARSANAAGKQCGYHSIVAGGWVFPTYTTDMYCNETEQSEEMKWYWNHWCGFCIVFNDRGCQGDVRWNGGPHATEQHDVKGAKSYFCY